MALNVMINHGLRRTINLGPQKQNQLHQHTAKFSSLQMQSVSKACAGAPILNCLSATSNPPMIGGNWSVFSVRHKIRNNFPKPREEKRLAFSWEKRMLTEGGRSILMRRILKGAHAIAHPTSIVPHWHHRVY